MQYRLVRKRNVFLFSRLAVSPRQHPCFHLKMETTYINTIIAMRLNEAVRTLLPLSQPGSQPATGNRDVPHSSGKQCPAFLCSPSEPPAHPFTVTPITGRNPTYREIYVQIDMEWRYPSLWYFDSLRLALAKPLLSSFCRKTPLFSPGSGGGGT